jgi:hypothetical protein
VYYFIGELLKRKDNCNKGSGSKVGTRKDSDRGRMPVNFPADADAHDSASPRPKFLATEVMSIENCASDQPLLCINTSPPQIPIDPPSPNHKGSYPSLYARKVSFADPKSNGSQSPTPSDPPGKTPFQFPPDITLLQNEQTMSQIRLQKHTQKSQNPTTPKSPKLNLKNNESEIKITGSFYEIYNEQIRDLLSENCEKSLQITESEEHGVIINSLNKVEINNINDLREMLFIGSKRRIKAPTENNEFSSRSHALVEIRILRSVCVDGKVWATHGKALLVDLAGSER